MSIGWHDLCNDPAHTGNTNCNPDPPNAGAASQSVLTQLPSTTATTIHDAAHAAVTVVAVGTTVHDFVTVSGGAGNPTPTGSVTIDWFTNNTCAGAATTTSAGLALTGGSVDATGFPQGPLAPGLYGFEAHYLGDPANPVYAASDGPCEPLRVVDANIQITPPTATNRVGQTHTFTAHVNVNDGTGFVNAPAGTSISFTINSGPGSFTTTNPCATVGATGSCTIDLTSLTTGVTNVSATTTVSVGGVSLSRTTNGAAGNSGPAVKRWVNARIKITPDATNEIGQLHTFVVTLEKDLGDGAGFVAAPNEHVDVTLTGVNGASAVVNGVLSTCDDAGPNTNPSGQCSITFSSATAGKVLGHASSTPTVAGLPVSVQTDGVGQNSGDATKTFVDANIQINPPTATNRDRPDAHLHRPRERERRQRRVPERAGRHADHVHQGLRAGQPLGAVLPDDRRHRQLHGRPDLGDDRRHDGLGPHDGHGRRRPADAQHERRRPQLRAGRQDLGQREDHDRARRDQRGRSAAHLHGDAVEGHRRTACSCRRRTSTSRPR